MVNGESAIGKTCKVHHWVLHFRYNVLDLAGLAENPTCQDRFSSLLV